MRRYLCLVVEDSETMRNMLSDSLIRIPGMEVVEAENGLAGIRALATQQFDLVVLDEAQRIKNRSSTTSQIRPVLARAALNKKNLPKNPATGGIPANENSASIMTKLSFGLVL